MKILGYLLFGISFIAWSGILIVPLTDYSVNEKTGISGGLFIFGEITFWISIAILGKTF